MCLSEAESKWNNIEYIQLKKRQVFADGFSFLLVFSSPG